MKQILSKIWYHLEEIFLIPSLIFSVGLIFVQVVMRYIFNNSISWSEELARYIYIWQTWIGVSYAARNGTHLRISMIKDRLPKNGQKVLELFVTAIWIAFAIFIIYQGIVSVKTIAGFGQMSSALQIPMQFCYAAIPVGMILMCLRLVEQTIRSFRKPNELEISVEEGGAEA